MWMDIHSCVNYFLQGRHIVFSFILSATLARHMLVLGSLFWTVLRRMDICLIKMNYKLFFQSAVGKTVVLLLTYYLHQVTCQVLQESQSIRILEVEPSSSSVTIPCIFSDGAKHPLYLFYKRQLISTHENDTFDPKKGFVVTLHQNLPLRGVVYECRVPGASGGSGGQYRIVRVVPNWGVRTSPPKRRVDLHSDQDLNISCSSGVSNWTPLTLLRNFSETVSSCTTSSKISSCSLLAATEHIGGQYLCISGSASSNASLFQSQIVASWHVHVLQPGDRVQVQLNETGTDQSKSVICTATKNGKSTLESCECKNKTHCKRLRDQLRKTDSCKPITPTICNASATTENPETVTISGTTKRVSLVTNLHASQVYRCFAKVGGDQTINCAQDVRIVDPPEPAPPYVIIIVVVISLLLLVTIGLALFYRQKFVIEKFKVQKLTEREIYEFIYGNQNEIDNQKDMAEQAHLLPYNRSLV